MDISITYLWLFSGVLLLVAEAIGLTGIGLMFAGLGAITVGAALNLGLIAEDAHVTQFSVCFIASATWAGLLWKTVQKFRSAKHSGYNNIVGETAYVGSNGITKTHGGEVTWSGTIMKAHLAQGANVDKLEAGSAVTIVEVTGATLVVKPKA